MARTRRLRRGGDWTANLPFAQRMAVKGAQAYGKHVVLPTAKFALRATGADKTAEYQAAKAAWGNAKTAWASPQGQALRGQAIAMARQAVAPPAPMANPYGRSAGPAAAPIPVAQRVPTAQPVAAPVAAAPASGQLSMAEQSIAHRVLMFHALGKPSETDASSIADIAKRVNNKDRNNALLAGIGALATDVKALHDAGTPQTVPFETAMSRTRGYPNLNAFELYEKTLADPASRSRIAQELVSAQDPPGQPNSRRFLAGVINQYAAAVRNAMQKRLLLGGKTRRARKMRRMTRRSL